jgi:hypothetical protein
MQSTIKLKNDQKMLVICNQFFIKFKINFNDSKDFSIHQKSANFIGCQALL